MKHANGRLLAGILATVAIGGVLAGCGGNDSATTGQATTAPSASANKPSADAAAVDRAFVRQMVPHHEMALDMAELARTRGEHDEITQLADEIVAAQKREIAELETIAKALGVTPAPAMGEGMSESHGEMMADAKTLGLTMDEMGMSMDMASLEGADPFDQAFIEEMTPHHEGAIAMAKAELAAGKDGELKRIASAIVSAQEKEIAQMARWKADWYPGAGDAADGDGAAGMSGAMGSDHSGH